MPPFPNLISESLLVSETIELLQAAGGRAPAVKVVDYVMKIRRPELRLARMLVSDLVQTDPRLKFCAEDDCLELIEESEVRKLAESEYVVFDLETTGAKTPPCRITEIGAYRVKNGAIAEEFHTLVNPEAPIPVFITQLTGITDSMVRGAPKFHEIAADFLNFIGDSVLVAHNAQFDLRFLNYEIGRIHENYRMRNPYLCTVQLSRKLLPHIENHRLNTVACHYRVQLVNHHRATDDARATAHIFLNLLEELEQRGVSDVESARKYRP